MRADEKFAPVCVVEEATRSVLVCGSRDWPHDKLWFVTEKMIELAAKHRVIAGGARGVDRHAYLEALRLGWPTPIEDRADWSVTPETPPHNVRRRFDGSLYDVTAGYRRNLEMLDMQPDLVLAFLWDDSKGTAHTIKNARKRGIPTRVFTASDLQPDLFSLGAEPVAIG